MNATQWKRGGATFAAAVAVTAALAWYESTPERRRDKLEREIAGIEADDRADAAEHVRDAAACTADGVEFGSQSKVVDTCWSALRNAEAVRAKAREARSAALERLRAELADVR